MNTTTNGIETVKSLPDYAPIPKSALLIDITSDAAKDAMTSIEKFITKISSQ